MGSFPIQPVFSRGEISPKLHSRVDLEQYKTGLKELMNMMVMRQGGVCRRPGTKFVNEVKDSTKPCRLLPFIYRSGASYVAYVLAFNAGVFRAYALDGRVGSFEVSHGYADVDLWGIDYDQTNDVMDLTHKTYAPQRISRFSDISWTITVTPAMDGPYLPINVTPTFITPSDLADPIPIMTSATAPSGTAAASNASSGGDAFKAFDKTTNTLWSTNVGITAAWLSYTFTSTRVITGYAITASSLNSSSTNNGILDAPKSWTFEGFDGTNWIILDSEYAQTSWSLGETRSFLYKNATAYIAYRINILGNNTGDAVQLSAMSFLEDPTIAAGITLTASSTTGINNNVGFSASDVGRFISLLSSDSRYHPFQISAFTSSTVVTAKATGSALPSTQTSVQWKLGAWGTTPGWPAHACTFEGRKIYARTDAQPSGIWGTRSNGYGSTLDFSVNVPIQDDDSITFTLADVNEIQWVAEGRDMAIGTGGAARSMGRDSPNLAFSANNYRQALESTYGSQPIRPTKVGGSTIFVSAYGKALREFVGSASGVGYDTPDISVMSDHLFASGVIEMTYQQEPNSVVWSAMGNGELVGLTYEKQQQMAGFHHHQLGGVFGTGIPVVESACSIPGNGQNELWMVVKRTINGATKRYIERLTSPFDSTIMPQSSGWYVDCALQYNGAPTTAVGSLTHLEGQTVAILADGAREMNQVVTGGSVSLASGRAASVITVGLPYTSRMRTLPSSFSLGDGSGLGRRKKINRIILDLLDCGPIRIGRHTSTAEEVDFRNTTDNLGAAQPLYTGFQTVHPETSWFDNGELVIIADGPQPATVLSVTPGTDAEP